MDKATSLGGHSPITAGVPLFAFGSRPSRCTEESRSSSMEGVLRVCA